MKTNIKTTNFSLTPSIEKAIREKLSGLDKFIFYSGNSIEAFVEVALETKRHKKGNIYYAEINIKVPGKILRAESRKEDLYQAISEIKDEMQRILKKEKEKVIAKRRKVSKS